MATLAEDKKPAAGQQFFPIALAIMQPGTLAPVDIYIRTDSPAAYRLYKKGRTELSEQVRQRLLERGVAELYLRREEEDAYYDYVEANVDAIVGDALLPPEEACRIVYQSSSRVMYDVFENPRSGTNLKRAQKMVEGAVQSIMNNPDALWQMTSIASHHYYTYTHCVNVCAFLVAASKELLGITERAELEQIGIGGMLHDIGKSEIPEGILSKPGKLNDEEWSYVRQHPVLGEELLTDQRDLSPTARVIIRHHHEHADGSGYPDGLTVEEVDRVVRLATLVDVYDALTTERSYAPARPPYRALGLMLEEMAPELDQDLLRDFVQFLGPGSEEA